ncbi:S-adenosyl-L-methionine-dependent methyltransferase [Lentinula guzmanii]|uniref:S-adenosyl-L-methionine-dependent methyltransferase n=1 Tax=Lentinula guzmanii TaxID=2804957 RepID=A0AA38JM75_9AGAR|nr:S-adenosyl-L-methionine-dependent methyltransferase [Lentinula guzmanii]
MTTKQSDPLKALVDIISSQTAVLQSTYAQNNSEFPSLNTPFQPTALEFDPNVTAARNLIIAAATQLIATVQSPIEFVASSMGGVYDTVTLGLMVDINVPEILKEAGTQGLHVDQLASATGVDSSYLSRVLRYLAIRHVFKEVSPDVFTHNRLSSMLTKAKSLKEIKEDPNARFDNAPIAASLHMGSTQILNSSTALISFIKNPKQASAPFNMAYKTSQTMFEWMEKSGNGFEARVFTAAMKVNDENPPEIYTSSIQGNTLKPNDTIVDVGGGRGSVTFALHKAYPKLRYVVQDLDQQIAAAKKFWDEKDAEAIKTGQVQLRVHDFFTPQPIKDAAVYFLCVVIHDWSDEDARKILSNIRPAAGAHSKLVLYEMVAEHITESHASAPYPLLPDYAGAGFLTILDIAMLSFYNGKERTSEEYAKLGRESGWQLEEVKPGKLSALIFTPI